MVTHLMDRIPDAALPLIEGLKEVGGIQAVVLGGSRARGTHTPESDVDLGLYYRRAEPLDVRQLGQLAENVDDRKQSGLVTQIGGWGPRINGGGWLMIGGKQVDLIYRDLDSVDHAVNESIAGRLQIDYQPGHPFGFLSSIYAAEVSVCLPLWDPLGKLESLKSRLAAYPPMLKQAMIRNFAWEILFSVEIAEKAIHRADVAFIAGALFRSLTCMLVVLFALNEQPWLNEKGAMALTAGFTICPERFKGRAETAIAGLAAERSCLEEAVAQIRALGIEVETLAKRGSTRG